MYYYHAPTLMEHRVIGVNRDSRGTLLDTEDAKRYRAGVNSLFSISAELLAHLCTRNVGYLRQYLNTTSQTVTIVERGGVRLKIAPTTASKQEIILRQWYFIPMAQAREFTQYLYASATKYAAGNEELALIIKCLEEYISYEYLHSPNQTGYPGYSSAKNRNDGDKQAVAHYATNVFNYEKHLCIFVDALISQELLLEHDSIYVHNRDVVVSLKSMMDAPAHPFDGYAAAQDRLHELYEQKGLTYHIDIVNEKEHISRYVLLGKEVHRISSIKDETRADGVYVIVQKGVHAPTTTHYRLDEVEEKLGLYSSEELARTYGNLQLEREQALETLRHENRLLQLQIENDRARIEKEILTLKHEHAQERAKLQERLNRLEEERARIQHERDMFKHEIEFERLRYEERLHRLKEEYEQSSFWRKNATELIKLWPIILTIAAGVVAIHAQKAKST